jgi:peptide/nickel transport system ATP-binding protein
MDLLQIDHLVVRYRAKNGIVEAADVEWINIGQGEMFGLVGESGCGKSTVAKAITRLLPETGYIEKGQITLKGTAIARLSEKSFNKLRWKEVSIIPQSAMNSLDPVYKIRTQIEEALKAHADGNSTRINRRIDELMELVGLNPRRAEEYPHEFSGGMRQRAMIAMALALNPSLVIADEPTTALDVIMQDQILGKILELHKTFGMSMLLITHDIAIVAQVCDRMAVMYAGNVMEIGPVRAIFKTPYHPYTIGLQKAFPSVRGKAEKLISIQGSPPSLFHPPQGCRFFERCPWALDSCRRETSLKEVEEGHFSACHRLDKLADFRQEAKNPAVWLETEPRKINDRSVLHAAAAPNGEKETVVTVKALQKWFPLKKGIIASLIFRGKQRYIKAVDGVSFELERGKILGIAGESGCGKTTVGRLLTYLTPATAGHIFFDGTDITTLGKEDLHKFHKKAQMIFQDPYESLNPRRTVYDTIGEPLTIQKMCPTKTERDERIKKVLSDVGLGAHAYYLTKFPHELSGGERQRVAIARALVLDPSFLVADEPVSMLDVSIRAGILLLLERLTAEFKMSTLYISHDLSTVRYLCHKTAIMYLGRIVETGKTEDIFENPLHPYTRTLLAAVPIPDPEIPKESYQIKGEPPDPIDLPKGCRFKPRCPFADQECNEEPALNDSGGEHYVSCWKGKLLVEGK